MPVSAAPEPLAGDLLAALGRGLAEGWLLDAVLALLLLEAIGLLAWHRLGRGPAPGRWWPMLAAGGGLLLAWRLATAGAAAPWPLLALAAAGAAHGLDLWRRCRAWSGASGAGGPAAGQGAAGQGAAGQGAAGQGAAGQGPAGGGAAGRAAPARPVKAPAPRSG